MYYYYTVAKNEEGKSFVIDSEFTNRMEAIADIRERCKLAGLVVGNITTYPNKRKGGNVLTKNILKQKRDGTLAKWFS